MVKTAAQIERDLYRLLSRSALAAELRGGVYRADMRPYGSEREDMVVAFLAGVDAQVQTGIVVLNIYVPRLADAMSGEMRPDKAREAVLEGLFRDFVDRCPDTEYLFATDGTPTGELDEATGQYSINARLKFQRITA